MDKLFFSIGEAAQTIGESTSLVRYWTNEFDRHFKVRRSARGDRKYTAEDIETLKQIHPQPAGRGQKGFINRNIFRTFAVHYGNYNSD